MFNRVFMRCVGIGSLMLMPTVFCQKKRQVYIWGNGYYQARPDAILQFRNFFPKKIEGLPDNIQSLIFGEYYEAGIDDSGQLYIWQKKQIDANLNQGQASKDSKRQNVSVLHKNVKDAKFTSGYIWILTKDNKVYQYPILKKFNQNSELIQKKIGSKRQVQPLKDTIQLKTGNDHVIALKKDGFVYAMGDDTYGQCGQADTDRNTNPPYVQKRIKYPAKVKNLANIVKICAGSDHNMALDQGGNLFGWGSNSVLQLSHEQEHSKMTNPLLCSFTPLRISKNIDLCRIRQICCGNEFNVLLTENRSSESCEVYTFGNNLRGQLGIQQVRHLKDISKVENLSNFVINTNGQQKKVDITQLQCGNNHCIALLNIGYIMEWGDNEYGQMGNKKRSPASSPIVLKNFNENKNKIVGVFAGNNASGAIIEVNDD